MGTEETELEPGTEAEAESAPRPAGPPLPPGAPGAPRRAPGQKEVIPFAWKVCGYSQDGLTLTLFKSVERPDCEGQLERLQREGYYGGLAIYKVDEVPPPAVIKKPPAKGKRPATPPASGKKPAGKAAPAEASKAKRPPAGKDTKAAPATKAGKDKPTAKKAPDKAPARKPSTAKAKPAKKKAR